MQYYLCIPDNHVITVFVLGGAQGPSQQGLATDQSFLDDLFSILRMLAISYFKPKQIF